MRSTLRLALAASLLVLAACGSSDQTPNRTVIPSGIADRLASDSEAIAAALESGDVCGAAQRADELKRAADAAIDRGQVPVAFQGELAQTVLDLQNEVNCPPPAEEKDEEQGKGKKKGKEKEGETTGVTVSLSTTTEEGE